MGKHTKRTGARSRQTRKVLREEADARGQYAGDDVGSPTTQVFDEEYHTQVNRRRRRGRAGRVILFLIVFLLVAALACGVWYMHRVNSALSLGGDKDSVKSALTEAKADEPFYMLLLGSDSREHSGTADRQDESGDNERSDVMILVRVDAAERKLTMLSIPRDTPHIDSSGNIMKINEVYNRDGAAGTIKAVQQLVGVPISHYAEIHFSGFQELVDSLGGVDVNVPIELSYSDALTGERVTLQPGQQTLDGQQAQIFARARHEYAGNQDEHRQEAVRAIVAALVKKAQDTPVTRMPGVILSAAECVSTDMDVGTILPLALELHEGTTVYSGTGPTAGAVDEAAGGLWLCYQDDAGWERVMRVVDSGDDPSKVSYAGDTARIAGTEETVTIGE